MVMKERVYQKPTTKVYQIQVMKPLAGSGGTGGGNTGGGNTGGGGISNARRFGSPWDDEE